MTAITHTAHIPDTLRTAGQLFRPCPSSANTESATHSQATMPAARVATIHREITDRSTPDRAPASASVGSFRIPDRKTIRPSLAQAAAASPRLPSSSPNPRPRKTSPRHDPVARTSTPQNITTDASPRVHPRPHGQRSRKSPSSTCLSQRLLPAKWSSASAPRDDRLGSRWEMAAHGRDAAANESLPEVGVSKSKNFQDRRLVLLGEVAGKAEYHLTAADQRNHREESRAVSGRSTANRQVEPPCQLGSIGRQRLPHRCPSLGATRSQLASKTQLPARMQSLATASACRIGLQSHVVDRAHCPRACGTSSLIAPAGASGSSMLPPPFPQLAPATGLQPMSSDPHAAQPALDLECSA